MRKIFLVIASLLPVLLFAQSTQTTICLAVDCKDTVRLPVDTVSLNGSANGFVKVLSIGWKQVTGNPGTLDNTTTPSTTARGLKAGTYVFAFNYSVTGGSATLYDTVVVTAAPPPPVANIQPQPDVTLPYPAVILSGAQSSDPSGAPLTYLWSKLSGPTGDQASAAGPLLIVQGVAAGKYTYQLTVTSANGSSAAQVSFGVNPPAVYEIFRITLPTGKTIIFYSDGTSK